MSTALLDIQNQLRKELQAQSETLPPVTGSGKISTADKIFTLPNGQSHDGPLNCIILDWRWQHSYFKGVFKADNKAPPLCWSSGKDANALKPDPSAKEPQNATCEGCPKDEWGSSPTGDGKACKNSVRIAVVPPDFTADMTPWIIDASPTAIKSFTAHVMKLQTGHQLLPMQVITELTFNPAVSYPTLIFKNPGVDPTVPTTVADLATLMTLRQKAQTVLR